MSILEEGKEYRELKRYNKQICDKNLNTGKYVLTNCILRSVIPVERIIYVRQ